MILEYLSNLVQLFTSDNQPLASNLDLAFVGIARTIIITSYTNKQYSFILIFSTTFILDDVLAPGHKLILLLAVNIFHRRLIPSFYYALSHFRKEFF